MKAIVFDHFGDPGGMRLGDLPDPEPGPGQVRIAVRAVGINHVDLDIRAGVSRLPIQFPHILGLEFAGTIDTVGDRVEGWTPGDRVAPYYQVVCRRCGACLRGEHMHCERLEMFGIQRPGGYAELAVADAEDLIALPDHLSFESAAAVQTTYGTAWRCLVTRARLRAGETVLVSAAGSGVGTATVQIAKLMGARVIASAGSAAKLERALEHGADAVVNYTTNDIGAAVRDATDGRGVDVAFEHVGGEVFGASLGSVAVGGRLTVCGGHAGEVVPLDLIELFRTEHVVIGCARATHAEIATVMRLVGEGRLNPVLGSVHPLSDADRGHAMLGDRAAYGKVILRP
jgi:NADPH:quinone reductase-like Zn-dependent oxidoreductase